MKNVGNVETVDFSRHGKLRVKSNPDFAHAKELNLAAVTLTELSACACNFPIVFIQNPDKSLYRPVVLLGLRPGENVFYGKEGWDSTYAPLMIQRHPFVIGFDDRLDDRKELTTCLNTDSPFLSSEEGIAMFTEAGEETDFLKSVNQILANLFESEKVTERLTKKLLELDLLTPLELLLQPANGEVRKVEGMHTIDDIKLRNLTAEQLQEMYKDDFMAASYLIQTSLFQLHKLIRLRNAKLEEKIQNYRIELPKQPKTETPAA